MIKVTKVVDVNEIIKCWPRLYSLALKEVPTTNADQLLQLYLTCFQNGAVFLVRNDSGLCGVCCVEHQPNYTLALRCVPNDRGTGIAKACIAAAKDWGRKTEHDTLIVSTERLSGSSFKYFEKSLGFRRKFVTFTLPIN